MMDREAQNFVTILTKLHPGTKTEKLNEIEQKIADNLGNYSLKVSIADGAKSNVEVALDKLGLVHFASLHVIRGEVSPDKSKTASEPHYLFLELTVDGPPDDAINKFVDALSDQLSIIYGCIDPVLKNASEIKKRLIADQYQIKRNPWPNLYSHKCINGLPFSGTAGLDLKDMHDDTVIADYAQKQIQAFDRQGSAADIFRHVKKSIIENHSDATLGRAWKRASSRKRTPNFAEDLDSSWKENWSQFKLFTAIIPSWLKLSALLVFVAIFFFMDYIFGLSGETKVHEIIGLAEGCVPNWDKVRYTGSPFWEKPLQESCPKYKIVSLYPWFLFEGLLFAFAMYFFLRLTPSMFPKASGMLTIICGFNLFLWFPNIFNPSGAYESLDGENIGYFCIVVILGLYFIYWLMKIIRRLLNSKPKYANPIHYSSSSEWVNFTIALFVLAGYLYLGWNFLNPGNKNIEFAYTVNWFKLNEVGSIRIEQIILVPALLSAILCLNLYMVFVHTPLVVKSHFKSIFGSRKSKNLSRPIIRWLPIFLIFGLSYCIICYFAFTDNSNKLSFSVLKSASFKSGVANFLVDVFVGIVIGVFTAKILPVISGRNFSFKSSFIFGTALGLLLIFNDVWINDEAIKIYASLLLAIPVTLVVFVMLSGIMLALFLASQFRNKQRYDNPYTDVTDKLFHNESKVVQNHMISIQRLIPENFRRNFTLPLMLQAIGGILGKQRFRPGFLANVGTVHSARWIHLPDTDNYVFVSNYDGSFESYLEDFSKMAIEGTNLAWSNCLGFPKIRGVFKGGVQDSDRFKRFARRSMQPTPFWYSAVSDKSAEQIRRNALIRDGLTRDSLSASQAQAWIDLFTSVPRPEWIIEKDKVQNIVFGGSGHLSRGGVLTVKRQPGLDDAKIEKDFSEWIDNVREYVAFDGEKPEESAVYIAFSSAGLRALGLDDVLDDNKKARGENDEQNNISEDNGRKFSQPFVSGMSDPSRRNILGDIGVNSPNHWDWSDEATLAVVMVYDKRNLFKNKKNLFKKSEFIKAYKHLKSTNSLLIELQETFRRLASTKTGTKQSKKFHKEPFGFADGISQPILKGTKAGLSNPNSIHLVEPGEFILGYRDNSGYFPPSPVINAAKDINELLPNPTEDVIQRYPSFHPSSNPDKRDLGRNGSYLVIRKLEQDVEGFHLTAKIGAALFLSSKKQDLDFLRSANPSNTDDQKQLKKIFSSLNNGKHASKFKDYSEWIEYLFVGRHKDGTALIDCPLKIIKGPGQSIKLELEKHSVRTFDELKAENEFLFKDRDPQGHKCPFGSHVRRANPRDGLNPEHEKSLEVTQRHRILRRGRAYEEKKDKKIKQGTFFMCLNADIDRQFELLQQTWLMSSKFHGLRAETDPVAGQGITKTTLNTSKFTIQTPQGDIQIPCMSNFVQVKAGGYFFLPGKETLQFLGALHLSR